MILLRFTKLIIMVLLMLISCSEIEKTEKVDNFEKQIVLEVKVEDDTRGISQKIAENINKILKEKGYTIFNININQSNKNGVLAQYEHPSLRINIKYTFLMRIRGKNVYNINGYIKMIDKKQKEKEIKLLIDKKIYIENKINFAGKLSVMIENAINNILLKHEKSRRNKNG